MNESNEVTTEFDPLENTELLTEILRAFIPHTDKIRVDENRVDNMVYLSVHLDPEDIGIAIGKEGQTILAIQHIFAKIGAASRQRIHVNVVCDTNRKTRPGRSRQS